MGLHQKRAGNQVSEDFTEADPDACDRQEDAAGEIVLTHINLFIVRLLVAVSVRWERLLRRNLAELPHNS
jgi:hypothetical protein